MPLDKKPERSEPAAAMSTRQRWAAMITLLAASFMNLMDVTIVNVALPSLQHAFGASDSQIAWVAAAYILVFGLGLLPFGRLGDIAGKRRLFVIGLVVFTTASALCGAAWSIESLIAARVVQALGGAMMAPQTLAMVPSLMPVKSRPAAYALFGLTAGLASVAGPVLGGLLIGADVLGMGWRTIFFINLPIGALAVLAAYRFVPELRGTGGQRNDIVGIAIAGAALFMLIFPLLEGRQVGWPGWAKGMLIGAIPVTIAFVLWLRRQERVKGPQLIPLSLLRNRAYAIGSVMTTILFSTVPGFFLVLAMLLQTGYGLSALQSGLTSVPFSLGVLVSSAISGKLGARWPRRRIALGTLVLGVAIAGLRLHVAGQPESIVWAAFAPWLFAAGVGFGTAIAPMFQTVLSRVEPRDLGSGSGALQALQQVGGAFGVAIIAGVFFARVHQGMAVGETPRHAHAAGFDVALWYSLFAYAAVILMARWLPPPDLAHSDSALPSAEVARALDAA